MGGRSRDDCTFRLEPPQPRHVPSIADLLDVKGLQPIPGTSLASRAFIANVLAFRRRKGTASVIERLAEDVTG